MNISHKSEHKKKSSELIPGTLMLILSNMYFYLLNCNVMMILTG